MKISAISNDRQALEEALRSISGADSVPEARFYDDNAYIAELGRSFIHFAIEASNYYAFEFEDDGDEEVIDVFGTKKYVGNYVKVMRIARLFGPRKDAYYNKEIFHWFWRNCGVGFFCDLMIEIYQQKNQGSKELNISPRAILYNIKESIVATGTSPEDISSMDPALVVQLFFNPHQQNNLTR